MDNITYMPETTLKSLKRLLNYIYEEEELRWIEDDFPKEHIFHDIIALKAFVNVETKLQALKQ